MIEAKQKPRGLAKGWQTWLVTLAMLVAVYFIAPQQITILPYKALAIGLGGMGGFWLFFSIEGDIGCMDDDRQEAARYRRAAMMVGGMLAIALMV